jgi:hypothetical protein
MWSILQRVSKDFSYVALRFSKSVGACLEFLNHQDSGWVTQFRLLVVLLGISGVTAGARRYKEV